MNKKIIAVSLVILIITVMFAACGKDKGYKLDVDNNGFTHAYATDAEGNTVLNDNGDIIVYETDKHGKIVKDEDGKPKENSVEKPEFEARNDKYETDDFVLKIEDGWTNVTKGKYIKGENTDCFIEIIKDRDNFNDGDGALEKMLSEAIESNERFINNYKSSYPVATFEHGYKSVGGNNMYVFEFYVEDSNKNAVIYATQYYFVVGGNVYYITYADETGKEYTPDFDFSSYIEKNLTVKGK